MNASLICFVAALSAADPTAGQSEPVYTPSVHFMQAIRGQGPSADENGKTGTYHGVGGPQPYHFGWVSRYDLGLLPKAETDGPLPLGQFGVFEFNSEWQYTTPFLYGSVFAFAPQFNLRTWDGPASGTAPGLPGNVFRLGWDFELSTPANGAWSIELGFTPSINSDFEQQLSSNAWNFDGRGILYYHYTPEWMFAFGAGFWDRVNDRVIPYAGVVFTPDDWWEWRILFPESRISYFLGNCDGYGKWLYVSGEYHVEAYEIELGGVGLREKIELADWRIMLGLRMDRVYCSTFIEGGWVFGRDVEFLRETPGFDITSGFIGRIGLRF